MKLRDLGEREIIKSVVSKFTGNRHLNDCAVIDNGEDYLLLSTDLASMRNNIPSGSPPELIGEFVASINLSDIAAMAGIPIGMMISLSLSPSYDDEFLYQIMRGVRRKLSFFNAEILGGDTKEGDELEIAGTIIGRQKKNITRFRTDIKKDQIIGITGNVGRAYAGYMFYSSGYAVTRGIELMLDLNPRIREAQIISELGGKFMTDLSDGLFSSVWNLKSDFGIGVKIVYDEIPFHGELKRAAKLFGKNLGSTALSFGGDYELMFTIDNSIYRDFRESLESEKIPVSFIGQTWMGDNIIFRDERWEPMKQKGYEHFQPEEGL